jgi:hypothetical protein
VTSDETRPTATLHVLNTDPFDPQNLRLDQNFNEPIGVRKVITTVKCRKPHRQEFIRVHPHEDFRIDLPGIITKEGDRNGDFYPVVKTVALQLRGDQAVKAEVKGYTLFYTINRQGTPFLWPVAIEDEEVNGRRRDEWAISAREAAERAMGDVWVRVVANMNAGLYEVMEATNAAIPDPIWPEDLALVDLVRLSFKDRLITSIDHPLLKHLRGEC